MGAPDALAPPVELPRGVEVGHWTDRTGWTGCTVVLAPPGTVAAGEVRGGGPGTREFELLSPAAHQPGVQAVLFTGGSAFGLAAAHGVVDHLAERGVGYPTWAAVVPLVSAAVVYDLGLGDSGARPDADAGRSACQAASPRFERGSVGAGTGCTVGKLLGPAGWTKGGLGYASTRVGPALVGALAVVNAVGEVLSESGEVLAGSWRDGRYVRATDVLREGTWAPPQAGTATTLVCVLTDASLSKTDAWLVARAASAGVARAVDPCATAYDGDVAICLATGGAPGDALALSAAGAHVTAEAIRDGARRATGAPGCPAAAERMSGSPNGGGR
jgi:L-aminopeptidase/D-esterase-like protein